MHLFMISLIIFGALGILFSIGSLFFGGQSNSASSRLPEASPGNKARTPSTTSAPTAEPAPITGPQGTSDGFPSNRIERRNSI